MAGIEPAQTSLPVSTTTSEDSAGDHDLSGYSDEELFKMAGISPIAIESKPESLGFVDGLRATFAAPGGPGKGLPLIDAISGIPEGLGNAAIGVVQAATDAVDWNGKSEFSQNLVKAIKQRNLDQSKLPDAERAGIAVGEVVPTIPISAGPGGGLVATGALSGAAMSAFAPKEESGIVNRLKDTVVGGGEGAIAGGVLKVVSGVVKGTGNILKNAIVGASPNSIIAARLGPEKTKIALDELRTASPESVLLLPDVAGDSIRGLTRSIAKTEGARDIVVEALEKRSEGAVKRVSDALSKDISGVDAYFGSLDDIKKARLELSQPLYEKAFKENPQLSVRGNEDLFKKINQVANIKKIKRDFLLDESTPINSLVFLDKFKQELFDRAQTFKRQGANFKAKVMDELRVDITRRLSKLSPDYKKALNIYADESLFVNAQEEGLNFTKLTPEELRKRFSTFTTGEKDAFRIGVRENLQRTISATQEGADPAKRIFGNTQKREQLQVIFSDPVRYDAFKTKMIDEIKGAETKFKVLGGSRTDFNVENDTQFLNHIAQASSLTSLPTALYNTVVNAVKNRAAGLNQKNAQKVAKILMSRQDSINTLEALVKKEQGMQKRILRQFIDTTLKTTVAATNTNASTRSK